MAAGLPLPKSVTANGWLLFEESKMSKSRGNIVRAETIVEVLGTDALRYFLMAEIPFGQDGSFSFDALVARYNSDLANGFGNLVSRTLAMVDRYCGGTVPAPPAQPSAPPIIDGDSSFFDRDIAKTMSESATIGYRELDLSGFIKDIRFMMASLDNHLTVNAPWKLFTSDDGDRQRLHRILYESAEAIRIFTAHLYPFIPEAASKVWQQLGLGKFKDGKQEKWLPGEYEQLLQWGGLKPGTKLGELGPIFPRAEKDAIKRMQEIEDQGSPKPSEPAPSAPVEASAPTPEALNAVAPDSVRTPAEPTAPTPEALNAVAPGASSVPAPSAPTTPQTSTAPTITIDDFAKVELRVAQIKVAERIPKADKLLRLEVDLGYEQRQILAGIAEHYTPESLIGRKIVIIANLAPRKMRGLESNGMLLAASLGEAGKPVLAGFLEEVEIGARLK